MHRARVWLAATLVPLLLGLALVLGACSPSGGPAAAAGGSAAPAASPATTQPGAGLPDVAGAAARVRPATVLVLNLVPGRATAATAAQLGQATPPGEVPQGAGSGFIVDPSGVIVTNAHVVAGAQQLQVVLPPPDGRAFTAQLLGADPQTDLAVLQIEGQNLPTVPLGSSADLQVGEWVVAIGNALALPGGPTVTQGVVSATGRDAQEPAESPGGQGGQGGQSRGGQGQQAAGPTLYDLVQTDAAINPGNSGGPLVNLQGQVVGINTLGASDAEGINFAIAIDGAQPIIQQLRRSGKVTRAYLGVGGATVTPALAAALGLLRSDGVYVGQVAAGGPAAQAGIQVGDVIYAIDATAIDSQRDLQLALTNTFTPGQTVALRVARAGTDLTVQATLGTAPSQ